MTGGDLKTRLPALVHMVADDLSRRESLLLNANSGGSYYASVQQTRLLHALRGGSVLALEDAGPLERHFFGPVEPGEPPRVDEGGAIGGVHYVCCESYLRGGLRGVDSSWGDGIVEGGGFYDQFGPGIMGDDEIMGDGQIMRGGLDEDRLQGSSGSDRYWFAGVSRHLRAPSRLSARSLVLGPNSGLMPCFLLTALSSPGAAGNDTLLLPFLTPWADASCRCPAVPQPSQEINTLCPDMLPLGISPDWDWCMSAISLLRSLMIRRVTEESARVTMWKHFLRKAQQGKNEKTPEQRLAPLFVLAAVLKHRIYLEEEKAANEQSSGIGSLRGLGSLGLGSSLLSAGGGSSAAGGTSSVGLGHQQNSASSGAPGGGNIATLLALAEDDFPAGTVEAQLEPELVKAVLEVVSDVGSFLLARIAGDLLASIL